MTNTLTDLNEFISAALNSRKYPPNTATALRSALRAIEPQLNEGEKESIDTFNSNLDPIFQNFYNKYKTKLSTASVEAYKRRVKKLLNDFQRYGSDPGKMNSWIGRQKTKTSSEPLKKDNPAPESSITTDQVFKMNRFELALRPDVKAIILTPSDMTKEEAQRIKGYIEYLMQNAS